MKRARALAILNVISFLIHLGTSYLVQVKMINEKDVGEISDSYPSLFTPAGFTFAIWGIIYTCLGIFCVYHIVMAYKRNWDADANKDLDAIGILFILNNFATAAWLIAWTQEELLLSVVLIFIQLVCLLFIHLRLHIHNRFRSPGGKLATEFPQSIYLGWISLASIANTSSYLASTGWDGFGISAVNWTVTMIIIAIILGIFMVMVRRTIAYGLVIIWGLYGILSRLSSLEDRSYATIVNIAWAGIILVGISCLVQITRSITRRSPAKAGKT